MKVLRVMVKIECDVCEGVGVCAKGAVFRRSTDTACLSCNGTGERDRSISIAELRELLRGTSLDA